ncbi:PaaI family thioesterase [Actinocorallia longicatena]|uniref:Acyl-coenzyme A thioesterase THEM4 n=1 Tax=Actinocorallia longicatena TaxID=111803 RepID=A0ABP6QF35_9ACTN
MTTASPLSVKSPDRPFLSEAQVAVRARLADEVRALIEAAVLTDVAEAEIEEVADQVRAMKDRLAARRFAAAPMGDAPDSGLDTQGMERQLGNPVVGAINPVAPPILFEVLPDRTLRSTFTLGDSYEGPPGFVHGGISAAIFDQLLGMASAASGTPGFTAGLELRYRMPTPLRTPLTLEAGFTRREGRKSWADGRITTPDGTVTIEATALFITPQYMMPPEEDREEAPTEG